MSSDQQQQRYLAASGGRAELRTRNMGELETGRARVRVHYSGISVGTELETLRRSTGAAAEQAGLLGYQCCGVVEESRLPGVLIEPGQLIACYGGPYVHHADWLDVPAHLLAAVPDGVPASERGICGLGTIALHAFRCAGVSLGETVAVLGLGMLGNLVAQVARAAGCRVVALEPVELRRAAAEAVGVRAVSSAAMLNAEVAKVSGGHGADGVIVCAGNCDAELMAIACDVVRHGGCIAIVGLCDAVVPRQALFAKEARIVVPRAGGPGRYDAVYEGGGVDYPIAHARWTEHRNLQEFLRLLSVGGVTVAGLYEVVGVGSAEEAYAGLMGGAGDVDGRSLGVVFDWRAE